MKYKLLPKNDKDIFSVITSTLSNRAKHVLFKLKITTLETMLLTTGEDLLCSNECGPVTLKEIRIALWNAGHLLLADDCLKAVIWSDKDAFWSNGKIAVIGDIEEIP